jgi:two-component system, NarL family, response regulator DesR
MEAGLAGYMVKDAPAEKLIEAIRPVHRWRREVHPTLARRQLEHRILSADRT